MAVRDYFICRFDNGKLLFWTGPELRKFKGVYRNLIGKWTDNVDKAYRYSSRRLAENFVEYNGMDTATVLTEYQLSEKMKEIAGVTEHVV